MLFWYLLAALIGGLAGMIASLFFGHQVAEATGASLLTTFLFVMPAAGTFLAVVAMTIIHICDRRKRRLIPKEALYEDL